MNLWDIQQNEWSTKLLEIVGGDAMDLLVKLGQVELDGGAHLGNIHPYFTTRYNFPKGQSPNIEVLTRQIVSLSRLREIILQPSHPFLFHRWTASSL